MERSFGDNDFVLQFEKRSLIDLRSGAIFLDLHSTSFKQLHDGIFCRLSPDKFTHAYIQDLMGDQVTVELPLLDGIHFDYDGERFVLREFGGLQVSPSQNSGTFVGLQNGLLLEDPREIINKVLVCPHGDVSRLGDMISIDTNALKKPYFFRYELRSEMQDVKLRGNGRLGWIFLALLHAQTSGLCDDPFTGCTGTQRALAILRFGHCRGNLISSMNVDILRGALEPEMYLLLRRIAMISMLRKNYHSMQTIVVGCCPALCAHTGFAFLALNLASALINALKQIQGLGNVQQLITSLHEMSNVSCQGRTGRLSERALEVHRKCYPSDINRIVEATVLADGVNLRPVEVQSFLTPDYRKDVDFIALAVQNGEERKVREGRSSNIEGLFCDQEKLKGCRGSLQLSKNVAACFEILKRQREDTSDVPFRDIWLDLYRMARCDAQGDSETVISFNNLLALTSSEYGPEVSGYLIQLAIVARSPLSFPDPLLHEFYEITQETYYVKDHVDDFIDAHLEPFIERKPSLPPNGSNNEYEQQLRTWMEKQNRHKETNQSVKRNLEQQILCAFSCGQDIPMNDLEQDRFTQKSSLIEKLNNLFTRWRNSRDLKLFCNDVRAELHRLQRGQPLRNLRRELVRLEAADWESWLPFELPKLNSSTVKVTVQQKHDLLELQRTGWLACAYVYSPVPGSVETGIVRAEAHLSSILKLSGEAEADFGGTVLYERLVKEWQESVDLALASEEKGLSFLQDTMELAEIQTCLANYFERTQRLKREAWEMIKGTPQISSSHLSLVGLLDATTPWTILSEHFSPKNLDRLKRGLYLLEGSGPLAIYREELVNVFAVYMKHVQRARRCLHLLRLGNAGYPRLSSELVNPGCDGWTPIEDPEFIAFELDNDVTIRGPQAKVAKEMLDKKEGNRLLQLNMGCGKTAVIMPLLLCCAANGGFIARGTVLSSLYANNAADWQAKVGGLLNRHIFPMLCRRDIAICEATADRMFQTLSECREGWHIIVTVPEHRLSLENKALEYVYSILLMCWHHRVAIFWTSQMNFYRPKYQLVYTLGSSVDMDGGQLRWLLHAAVLQPVSRNAQMLMRKFRDKDLVELVEFGARSHEYTAIRLLENPGMQEAYKIICELVIDDILRGLVPWKNPLNLKMKTDTYGVWRRCVRGEALSERETKLLKSCNATIWQSSLCIRGTSRK
jgi:hypothetical protein